MELIKKTIVRRIKDKRAKSNVCVKASGGSA